MNKTLRNLTNVTIIWKGKRYIVAQDDTQDDGMVELYNGGYMWVPRVEIDKTGYVVIPND